MRFATPGSVTFGPVLLVLFVLNCNLNAVEFEPIRSLQPYNSRELSEESNESDQSLPPVSSADQESILINQPQIEKVADSDTDQVGDSGDINPAGIEISPVSGDTTESGGKAHFFIQLKSAPSSPITIPLSSRNPSEGIIHPRSLVFDRDNWSIKQRVTITGQNDYVADGNQNYRIQVGPAEGKDLTYRSIPATVLTLSNLETGHNLETGERVKAGTIELTPIRILPHKSGDPSLSIIKNIKKEFGENRIVVHPLMGATSEKGEKFTFKAKLKAAITHDFSITIDSSDHSEGSVSPQKLLFTSRNWAWERAVVVTGKDDFVADGDREYQLLIETESGFSQRFNEIVIPKVKLTNRDDDIPRYIIGDYHQFTSEDGGKTSIPVMLGSQPLSLLEVELACSSPGEGSINPEILRFSPENWNRQQVITVTGRNDFISDEDQVYQIHANQIRTMDPNYRNLSFPEINLVNQKSVSNEWHLLPGSFPSVARSSGFTISEKYHKSLNLKDRSVAVKELLSPYLEPGVMLDQQEKFTNESGETARFSIRLNTKPTVDVRISLKSLNLEEGTVSPRQLIFTPENWEKKQIATVAGEDDREKDGDIPFDVMLELSSDGDFRFSRLPGRKLTFINRDNDKAAIIMRQLQKVTSENKTTADFTVRLSSKPTAVVVVPISSSDTREGVPGMDKLVFSPGEWDLPKQVFVSGQNDDIADDNRKYVIVAGPATSEDKAYVGIKSSLQFTNTDNDAPGLITPLISGTTSEKGKSITLPISLKSEPVQDVIVAVTSSNTKEGIPKPGLIVFNSTNWNKPQIIEIFGQDDAVDDGDNTYFVHINTQNSKDTKYRALPGKKLTFDNEDDDVAGIKIARHRNATSESGGTIPLSVKLSSQPLDTVYLKVESSDPGEGKIVTSSINYTPQNWMTEQTIDVAGVDDDEADGDKNYKVEFAVDNANDPRYQLLDPVPVDIVNHDNDKAGFIIISPNGKTSEDGDEITVAMSLTTRPLHDVFIELYSSDRSEGIISPSSLYFTPADWNRKQHIQVKGVNDKLVDGEQHYTIVTKAAVSDDTVYHGLNPADILTANLDNNLTTFFVSQIRGTTEENGQIINFNIRLNKPPKGIIKISLVSSNPQEAAPSPNSILFDSSNWDQNKKVTIRGFDDDFQDGDQPYNITITSASQSDPAYNDIPPVVVNLINKDDDTAGIITQILNKMSTERGDFAEFTVKLSSQPTSSVVILFNSTNPAEGELMTEHAAFHSTNWNKEQIIRVKGRSDEKVDGNQNYTITSKGAVSSDPNYNKIPFEEITLVNKDIDEAKFIIGEVSEPTTEMGDTAQFGLRLNSIPQDKVTISLKSDNLLEGKVDITHLEFTVDNWDTEQTITVTGVDDFIKDEDKFYHIVFSSSVSRDGNYHGLSPEWVTLKNMDNKRLIVGARVSLVYPMDEFGEDFEPAYELAVNGGYVFNKKMTLIFSYSTVTLTGTPEKELYGDMHKVDQSLELTTLMSNVKYFLIKSPIILSAQMGVGLTDWSYTSRTLTDGTKRQDGGNDLTVNLGIGFDFAVYENLFIEHLLGLQQLTGGLGDRRILTLGFGVYYPF